MPHSAFESSMFPMTHSALEAFRDESMLVLWYVALTSMRLWASRWPTPCMVVAARDSSSFGIYVDPGPSSGKRPSFADEFYKDLLLHAPKSRREALPDI